VRECLREVGSSARREKMGRPVMETLPFVMGSTTVDHNIGYLPLPLLKAGAPRAAPASG
jgi:hypothetical protein